MDDYIAAIEDAMSATSTKGSPWFVIPANHNWFRKPGRVADHCRHHGGAANVLSEADRRLGGDPAQLSCGRTRGEGRRQAAPQGSQEVQVAAASCQVGSSPRCAVIRSYGCRAIWS